jgi:hypothetical protein
MNTEIFRMIHGSHLYGTATEHSDRDYKGLFLPDVDDVLTGSPSESMISSTKPEGVQKNSNCDVDTEMFSLKRFISLLLQGEMVAVDMLYTPGWAILYMNGEYAHIWNDIVTNRYRLVTKHIKGYMGYIRKQTAKYGIRGSRLHVLKSVLSYKEVYQPGTTRVRDILPVIMLIEGVAQEGDFVVINDKRFALGMQVSEFTKNITRMYERYGARAEAAEKNEGIDWKAVSHAVRASDQLIELYSFGRITFPLCTAGHIKEIKAGTVAYKDVSEELECKMGLIEHLAARSSIPNVPDRVFWRDLLLKHMREYVRGNLR